MATGWDPRLQRSPGFEEDAARLDVAIVMAGPLQMTTGSVAAKSRDPKSGSNANVWLGKTVDEDPELYALADAHMQVSKGDSSPLLSSWRIRRSRKRQSSDPRCPKRSRYSQRAQGLQRWEARLLEQPPLVCSHGR